MCSLNDDEFSNINVKECGTLTTNFDVCKKCKSTETQVLLRGKDAYCKTCFLTSTTHKFRAALGKSKIIRKGDRVLIGHSGKINSTMLLHLIKCGMDVTAHKRLIFETKVIYIDDGAIKNKTEEDRRKIQREVLEQVKLFGFPAYLTSLNQSLNESSLEIFNKDSEINCTNDEMLNATFNALPDETAKTDFLHQLRHKLLVKAARQLNCNKIFTADSATDTAIKILTNVSLGRGAQLQMNVGFCDTRYSDIILLRPMRDFATEEIEYYSNFNNLNVIVSLECQEKKKENSIEELTKKFVNNLDTEFHGTVSTVFRTGEKLSTGNSNEKSVHEYCALCNGILDTNLLDTVSAVQAVAFSKIASSKVIRNENSEIVNEIHNAVFTDCKRCDDCNCKKSKISDISIQDVQKHLCFGCKSIFHNFSSINNVPSFILQAVKTKISLLNMQAEIHDFLL